MINISWSYQYCLISLCTLGRLNISALIVFTPMQHVKELDLNLYMCYTVSAGKPVRYSITNNGAGNQDELCGLYLNPIFLTTASHQY